MELNVHYKYDELNRYYYLTTAGAELITGIDQLDKVWANPERRLKKQGLLLKTLMVLSTNDDTRRRCSRQDYVEYAQYKFTEQRTAVLTMLGEIAEWAYDVDGDRIAYEETNTMKIVGMLPITIRTIGRTSGMLDFSSIVFTVPEDEYRVGY